jgi:GT2 family glycosyltransferase
LNSFYPPLIENSNQDWVKIYVADNGSTDGSVNFLKENYSAIELILFDKNYGFTGGYNRALEQINAEYFVILNSDVEVTPNWLEPVIQFMDENEDAAACQPKIRSYAKKGYFEYAGAAGGFIDKYGYPFCRGRILDTLEEDMGQYDDIREIFWATGACMFVRSELFKNSEGFDEDFFAHMEEIDLCWRLKNSGYKIYYHPSSIVYHVGGGALPNNSPRKLYLNYRNNLFLLYKNLHSSQLLWFVFIRLLLDGISAIMYLATLKTRSFMAVFKAHLGFYGKIGKMHNKRAKGLQKMSKIKEIYPKSIVFGYFAKKRSNFRALNF